VFGVGSVVIWCFLEGVVVVTPGFYLREFLVVLGLGPGAGGLGLGAWIN
jgi:hypothetical protein